MHDTHPDDEGGEIVRGHRAAWGCSFFSGDQFTGGWQLVKRSRARSSSNTQLEHDFDSHAANRIQELQLAIDRERVGAAAKKERSTSLVESIAATVCTARGNALIQMMIQRGGIAVRRLPNRAL